MIKNAETWLCPTCALKTFKYGAACKEFHEGTCENIDKVHLTGRYYLKEVLRTEKSIGIAEIANEG